MTLYVERMADALSREVLNGAPTVFEVAEQGEDDDVDPSAPVHTMVCGQCCFAPATIRVEAAAAVEQKAEHESGS